MLERLIFYVLTVPTLCISGTPDLITGICGDAGCTLMVIADKLCDNVWRSVETLMQTIITDGILTREDFLGYRDTPDFFQYLRRILEHVFEDDESTVTLQKDLIFDDQGVCLNLPEGLPEGVS
jgi:hypothetical protein